MPASLLAAAVAAVTRRLDVPAHDAEIERLLPHVLSRITDEAPPVLAALAVPPVLRACMARALSGPAPEGGAQRPYEVTS